MDVFKIVGKIALDGQTEFNSGVDGAISKGKKLASTVGKGLATAAKVGGAALAAAGTAIVALGKQSIESFAEYEQLVGGIGKIFNDMDTSIIMKDANDAWKNLNMSASDYLATMVDVGANFASTMGDEKGYYVAQRGLQAITDYATGTGKNIDVLSTKFVMISRATSSYQVIADQFSGMLPATSKDFLEQAQAAGFLSDRYKQLTEVPIAEYQEAVSLMLEKGVDALGLTGNTADETAKTISGSINAMKSAWKNLLTGLSDPDQDIGDLVQNFSNSVLTVGSNILPKIKTLLPKITEGLGTLATGILPELLNTAIGSIPEFFSLAGDLLSGIASVIGQQFPSIMSTCVDLLAAFQSAILGTDWQQLGEDTADMLASIDWAGAISQLFSAIGAALGALGAFLIGLFSDAWDSVVEYLGEWVTKGEEMGMDTSSALLVGILAGLADLAVWCYDNILEPLITGIIDGLTGVEGAGKEVVESIKKGIKDAWDGLVTWFKGIWDSLFGNLTANVTVNKSEGSNIPAPNQGLRPKANGLYFVPYDGYLAELHKGETVLTRAEAEEYRWMRATGLDVRKNNTNENTSGITVIQNIQTVPQTPVELAAATQSYFEQARWGFA